MIRIYINNTRSKRLRYIIDKSVREAFRKLKIRDKIISITLTNDKEMKKLNNKYRNKNCSTDVLSFPFDDKKLLGDIYISRDTARKNAKNLKQELDEEISFLTIHSILHLIGYDHHCRSDKKLMQDKEKKIFNLVWGNT